MHTALIFVVLSLAGAAIGYTTKWTSVQLMFRPARFIGVGRIGWQGVVQRRSPLFAAGIADTLRAVVPFDELVERIDPDELAAVVAEALDDRLDDLAAQLITQLAPETWEHAPDHVRAALTDALRQEAVAAIAEVVTEARPLLPGVIDIDELVVELMSGENADRLACLVQTIGARELRAMIRYGAVVGFFVGLAEAAVYVSFERWWLLPAIGAVDGLLNNWMGIQMIFRPLEPTRYFGLFWYQGLFPARQKDIARDYGRMMSAEVLTPATLAERAADNGSTDTVTKVAREVLDRRLVAQLALVGPALGIEPTPELRVQTIDLALGALTAEGLSLGDFPAVISYLDERLEVAATIEERLGTMDKREFEKILRGIFENDELTLIAVGGVIGSVIGCLQAAILLGSGLAG